jgi:long-chain acyl-CoA synthetase
LSFNERAFFKSAIGNWQSAIHLMSRAKPTTESVYALRPWLDHYNYWTPPHMNYPRRPLHEILRITAAEVPDRPATAFLGQHLTFIELRDQADRFATALSRLGIAQADRVGIMMPNCPQYVIAAFALFRLGAIVVNVNPIYTAREVLVVAKDSGMRAVLTLDVLASKVLTVRDQTAIENVIITSLGEYSAAQTPTPSVEGTLRMADLLAGDAEPDLPRIEIDTDKDVAVLQYTGGTTGVPKGAMLTHRNIFANVVQTNAWGHEFTQRGTDCYLLVIPLFHIYGFTVGMIEGVWRGVQQVLIPRYDVEAVLTAIRDYGRHIFRLCPRSTSRC